MDRRAPPAEPVVSAGRRRCADEASRYGPRPPSATEIFEGVAFVIARDLWV